MGERTARGNGAGAGTGAPEDRRTGVAGVGKRTLTEDLEVDVSASPGRATLAQRSGGQSAGTTVDDVATAAVATKAGGGAVPDGVRSRVEPVVGTDLSHVRVHGDPGSRQATAAMGARAFAHGGDIFLGPGERADDVGLMAHELTHVAQQQGGTATPQRKVTVGEPSSAAEHEADAVAAKVVSSDQATLIVDGVATGPQQMPRAQFLAELQSQVIATATASLGPQWSAAGCPYIEAWFAQHAATPATELERIARRYGGAAARSARDYFEPICARLATGIAKWRGGGDVSADLSAAGLGTAAAAVTSTKPGVSAAPAGAQRKLTVDGGSSPAAVAQELGSGQPLDSSTASRMGDAFGQNFGGVRVHTGTVASRKASELGAAAFTVGSDVAFGAGQYAPGTPVGDALLAHELAHVTQQRRAGDDPAAQHAPIGGESKSAEGDADRATKGAVSRLVDPTKAAPRADVGLDTGFQLQRCSADNAANIPTGNPAGGWQNKVVAHQDTGVGGDQPSRSDITADRTLGTPQQSEDAALALVQTNGASGVVTLESGVYMAYATRPFADRDVISGGGYAGPPTCEPGVVALVTRDHMVWRPGQYDPGAKGEQATSDQKFKKNPGDPFQGYKDALVGGGDLNTANDNIVLAAFEGAMRGTAFSVLAESERAVREKQPKFDQGLNGVADGERALIRDTAAKLLPLQKQLDHAHELSEGAKGLYQVDGKGMARMLEESNQIKKTYAPQRNLIRQQYPMLARLSTAELEAFTKLSDEEQVKRLGSEFPGILKDITKTRDNIAIGKIDLWESEEIMEATMAGLGITSKEKRAVVLAEKKRHDRSNTITNVIKGILTLGLGIGAAIIGGPVGAAMAAGVLMADVADAMNETDQYYVKKSAANTDADPNKSILDPDSVPGWGWLVMSWAAVGLDMFDVKAAIKTIEAGENVGKVAERLGKTHAGLKGLSEGELVNKLKSAAGELKAGELLTEANKGGLGSRLGVSIEIDKSLADTEVRIGYKVDAATGKVEVTGMRVGAKAAIEDVLAHQNVLKLMRRYEGLSGKVRQLWDRMRSLGKRGVPIDVNPFPPGSRAWESWLEVKKLPQMIEARTAKYGPHLSKEAEALLRQDVDFLESELARHQHTVDQLILEAGEGFVAKAGDSTAKACNELGYALPDIKGKKPPFTSTEIADSAYYYRFDEGKDVPTLAKKVNRSGPSVRAELKDGKPTGAFLEGELTRGEKAEALVHGMPKEKQDAFNALVERTKQADPVAKVVPIEKLAATKQTLLEVTQRFGDKAFKPKLTELLSRALEKKGMKPAEALAAAKDAVEKLMNHEIMVVRGTDQLRAYSYRMRFIGATGAAVEDDLHHMVPLYLGGNHTVGNLIDIDAKLHDEVHALCESVKFSEEATLAPWSIQNAKNLTFSEGAAILHADGTVTFDTLATVTPTPK